MRMKVGMRLHLRAKFAMPDSIVALGLLQQQQLVIERSIVPLFPRDQTRPALTISMPRQGQTPLRRTKPAALRRCHIAPVKNHMPGSCVAAIDGIAATDTRLGCMKQPQALTAALAEDLLPEQAGARRQ
jgi:hypothetical protein